MELHPTTLRKYERVGFLQPSRTPGRTRLYSREDISRLQQIKNLVEEREINLAGVEMALELTAQLRKIQEMVDSAKDLASLKYSLQASLDEVFQLVGAREMRTPSREGR